MAVARRRGTGDDHGAPPPTARRRAARRRAPAGPAVSLPEPAPYDALVLGAGVSGLTATAALVARGLRVCLIDDYPEPGGNHLSWTNAHGTFDVGAILFWSDNPLFEVFPGMREACVPVTYGVEKVTPDGRIVPYPFDVRAELLRKGPRYAAKIFCQIAGRRLTLRDRRSSTRDFLDYYMGPDLLRDTGLGHYFARFYGLPPEEVDYEFALARLRWLEEQASLRRKLRRLLRRSAPARPEVVVLARPPEGFRAMYARATAQLAAAGAEIVLGAGIVRASASAGLFEVATRDGVLRGRRLINTMPLGKVMPLFGLGADTVPASSTLTTLFCRFRGPRGFRAPILYNFHADGLWKRLTVHSDYYGPQGGWSYLGVEVTETRPRHGPEAMFDDFRRTSGAFRLFEGEPELVDAVRTEFAYPVYDMGAVAARDASKGLLAQLGVESIGRQGAFSYLASSREAVQLASRIA